MKTLFTKKGQYDETGDKFMVAIEGAIRPIIEKYHKLDCPPHELELLAFWAIQVEIACTVLGLNKKNTIPEKDQSDQMVTEPMEGNPAENQNRILIWHKRGDWVFMADTPERELGAYQHIFNECDALGYYVADKLEGDQLEAYAKAKTGDREAMKWLIQLRKHYEYENVEQDTATIIEKVHSYAQIRDEILHEVWYNLKSALGPGPQQEILNKVIDELRKETVKKDWSI
jgi:hypothetical protein